ncbi:MAG: lysophospholipid acyltransferase family protein [Victivallales bacterium]
MKSAFVENIEYYSFLGASGIIKRLPLRISCLLAEVCGSLYFHIDAKHRTRVVQHLLHAGIVKDVAEARILARRNFVHFIKMAVEIFKCPQMLKQENLPEILSIAGSEASRKMFFPENGESMQAIVVSAHFGNWEVAGPAIAIKSGRPLMSIMRPFDNPRIGEYIKGRRKIFSNDICDKKGAVRILLKALKTGSSVAILPDQHAGGNEGVESVFFGHPAMSHTLPALLHLKTGIPIVVLLTRRVDDSFKFEFILSDPITMMPSEDKKRDVKELVQKYTSEIEKIVARYPEQWMWAHRRWLDINR